MSTQDLETIRKVLLKNNTSNFGKVIAKNANDLIVSSFKGPLQISIPNDDITEYKINDIVNIENGILKGRVNDNAIPVYVIE